MMTGLTHRPSHFRFLIDGTLGDSATTSRAVIADKDPIVVNEDDDGGLGDGEL
ncbi:hypothetical protein HK405_015954, partial [Cladochytrium tenue]